jgi:hypothetical protein
MVNIPDIGADIFIPGACLVGIAFAVFLWLRVSKISVGKNESDGSREALMEEQHGDAEVLFCFMRQNGALKVALNCSGNVLWLAWCL